MKKILSALCLLIIVFSLLFCCSACDKTSETKKIEVAFHCGDTYETFVDGMGIFCIARPYSGKEEVISLDRVRYYDQSLGDEWTNIDDFDAFYVLVSCHSKYTDGTNTISVSEVPFADEVDDFHAPYFKVQEKGRYCFIWSFCDKEIRYKLIFEVEIVYIIY